MRQGVARSHPGRTVGLVLLGLALLVTLAPTPAVAFDEAEAPLLSSDVAAAWHTPADVAPHTQWQGFLRMASGHSVVSAAYQICEVGRECFAPPHAARRLDNDTFSFDTASYLANGAPVDYQAGWRIGVKWILTDAQNVSTAFPQGMADNDPLCAASAAACAESHYLAFEMPPAANAAAPGPAAGILAVILLAIAVTRSRRA